MKRVSPFSYDPADNRFRIRPEHMAQLADYRKRHGLPSITAALSEVLTLWFIHERSGRKEQAVPQPAQGATT